jgi:hypothetical protein
MSSLGVAKYLQEAKLPKVVPPNTPAQQQAEDARQNPPAPVPPAPVSTGNPYANPHPVSPNVNSQLPWIGAPEMAPKPPLSIPGLGGQPPIIPGSQAQGTPPMLLPGVVQRVPTPTTSSGKGRPTVQPAQPTQIPSTTVPGSIPLPLG